MREITTHIIEGDDSPQLEISASPKGEDGLSSSYSIAGYSPHSGGVFHVKVGSEKWTPTVWELEMVCDEVKAALAKPSGAVIATNQDVEIQTIVPNAGIVFQDGPIKEVGRNGLTEDALIAILIDRFESFQVGPFASEANAMTLSYLKSALFSNQTRTRERIARGVEGTNAA